MTNNCQKTQLKKKKFKLARSTFRGHGVGTREVLASITLHPLKAGREQKVGEGRIIFSHPVVWPWCLKVWEKKSTTTHLSDLWAPAGPGEAVYTDISQHFPVHGLRGYTDRVKFKAVFFTSLFLFMFHNSASW